MHVIQKATHAFKLVLPGGHELPRLQRLLALSARLHLYMSNCQRLQRLLSVPVYICICRYMYDGVVEAQMYMLFDANKHLISTADIYPEVSIPLRFWDMAGGVHFP